MPKNKNLDQVIGGSFEELNTEDMEQAQGAGDVNAETVPIAVSIATIASAIYSSKKC
ncbi:MAG: lichenicidin A2 family type 2 lantibiotic [Pseudobutyrivibrio sp.]|nr:lichenicidin A2 family type 2 lantibiotic [Pseudobutyrivibrio sp.]